MKKSEKMRSYRMTVWRIGHVFRWKKKVGLKKTNGNLKKR